jgi:hypothetical protein
MGEANHHLNDIREIRSIMERSSQFLSLSGLSGIFAGMIALLGAVFIYFYQQQNPFIFHPTGNNALLPGFLKNVQNTQQMWVYIITAIVVLVLAISAAIFFSVRNARRKGMPVWNSSARRLIINLFIPISAGGLFCVILLYHNLLILMAPSMLIFYGLGLVNASKYTLTDIRYLGISEILLGMIAAIWVGYGLLFWTIGFGFLHLVYGFIMFWKYEKVRETKVDEI